MGQRRYSTHFQERGVPPSYLIDAFDEQWLLVKFLIVVPVCVSRASMSEEIEDEAGLTAKLWKPSDVLEAIENRVVKTAKFLRASKTRLERRPKQASVEDAIALADLIVALSRHGREQTASQAAEIATEVEILIDQLAAEIDGLL